jgi:GNAT superfamily N-acetyltransferase
MYTSAYAAMRTGRNDRMMLAAMEIALRAPQSCSEAELSSFRDLVLLGGEVKADHLSVGVARAHLLAFMRIDGGLAGVGCLKNPLGNYSRTVFRKAKSKLDATSFPFELGYMSVAADHRGKGVSRLLADALTFDIPNNLFATSAVVNIAMHRTLDRVGFKAEGETYESREEVGKMLSLFVRGNPR